VSEHVDFKAFLAGYLAEADEHLGAADKNLRAVEAAVAQGEASPRPVRDLFRSLHTIKGLSAMVGVEPIVEIAHLMESVLRSADRAGGRLDRAALDALANGLAEIDQRVRALAAGSPVRPPPPAILDALAALEQTQLEPRDSGRRPAPAAAEIWAKLSASEREQLAQGVARGRRARCVTFVPSPERIAAGLSITAVQERVARVAEIVKVVPRAAGDRPGAGAIEFVLVVLTTASDDELGEAAGGSAAATAPLFDDEEIAPAEADDRFAEGAYEPSPTASSHASVRVPIARLDDALEKLAAVVVTRFRLERAAADLAARGVDVRALGEILGESGRQIRELRSAIMRTRLVSVAELLERVPLIVRGLTRTTHKLVRVELDTGKAELDKAVAERVFPAIVHLVRNAVDHAIEPLDERKAAGKPIEGTVRVSCFERENHRLEICVADDGRGIDPAAVAAAAGRPVPTSDRALLALLVRPGLSTRDAASTTSGRGMGLDIVKRATVDELGGDLSVRTERGAGTAFTLRVPLSITIVDAFSFLCGAQRFVVPVSLVDELIEIDPARLARGPRSSGGGAPLLFEHRGEPVPIVALEEALGLSQAAAPKRQAIVVRRNAEAVAFAVDRLLGQHEVVVRPLGDPLVEVPGVTGSTDLGDGVPTLVLDLGALGSRLAHPMEAAA
jgi:two-component system chemotaxis sensor kinase CheA